MLQNTMQKGLSLIGVVVAVSILATSAIVVSRLVVETQRLAAISRDKFVAINLAREGLELVRVVRDTNAIDTDDATGWKDDICTDQDFNNFEIYEQGVYEWLKGRRASPINSNQDYEGDYHRTIDIDCRSDEDGLVSKGRIIVTAQVTWRNKNDEKSVEVKEHLYDWL